MKIPVIVRRFFESSAPSMEWVRLRIIALLVSIALLVVAFLLLYSELFGPPSQDDVEQFEFIVSPQDLEGDIAEKLEEAGLVRHAIAFRIAHGNETIRPGGYRVSLSMDAWTIADTLSRAPYLAWVTIPEGLRKEEVADLLARELAWSEEEVATLLSASIAEAELSEGIFYADTYLIPSDQTPEQVASRFHARLEDAVAPYADEIAEHMLSWGEILTLASIVEKESAKNDKPMVAGILLNRIERDMMLQADATLQYIKGNEEDWWPTPQSEDKYLESPYNTYQHVGLPPQPIASPSLDSILAVLRPQATSCLYYIHDSRGRIHCSRNYAGHVANIDLYLR